MIDWSKTMRAALVTGGLASVTSAVALAVAARLEGKATMQPINATSHWLNGDRAASNTGVSAVHTGVGYATNHAASVFWAVFFQAWLAQRPALRAWPMLQSALLMSAIAAAVDYGATPHRFTPGWELVLSKKGMALAYVGLALGLAGGGLLTQSAKAD